MWCVSLWEGSQVARDHLPWEVMANVSPDGQWEAARRLSEEEAQVHLFSVSYIKLSIFKTKFFILVSKNVTYQGKTEWQQVREKRKMLWEGLGSPHPRTVPWRVWSCVITYNCCFFHPALSHFYFC